MAAAVIFASPFENKNSFLGGGGGWFDLCFAIQIL